MRDYYDNRWHGMPIGVADFAAVPTGTTLDQIAFIEQALPRTAARGLS
jgi:hypothetical protein